MKISNHAKMRMRERTEFNHQERKRLFRNALDKGKSLQDIEDDKIKQFVEKIEKRNCKVKLYLGYVFIYSKHSKQLYTMYKLPKELEGGKNV